MKQNSNKKDQLSDIQRSILGCPVRILMYLLHLLLMDKTSYHWQKRHTDVQSANICWMSAVCLMLPSPHISHPSICKDAKWAWAYPLTFVQSYLLSWYYCDHNPLWEKGHVFHCIISLYAKYLVRILHTEETWKILEALCWTLPIE